MLHTNRLPYGGDSSIDGGRSEVSTSRVEGPECRRVPGQAGSTCKGPEITSADEGKGESNTGGFCGRQNSSVSNGFGERFWNGRSAGQGGKDWSRSRTGFGGDIEKGGSLRGGECNRMDNGEYSINWEKGWGTNRRTQQNKGNYREAQGGKVANWSWGKNGRWGGQGVGSVCRGRSGISVQG